MTFIIHPWQYDPASRSLFFHFEGPRYGRFQEIISLDGFEPSNASDEAGFGGLADLLSVALATSYYKLEPGGRIALPFRASATIEAIIQSLFIDGLGEFYARNDLPMPERIEISGADGGRVSHGSKRDHAVHDDLAIVAFGGGKDSHVCMKLMVASGIAQIPVSVALSDATEDKMQRLNDGPARIVRRRLDPRLVEINKRPDTLNGHIPITAINSLILSVVALIQGARCVVFANERGSSQFTRKYDGRDVNHQHSKSYGFEQILAEAIGTASESRVQYFSALRPYSEVLIGKLFTALCRDKFDLVASCNRNFKIDGQGLPVFTQRWCGACAKCVFTALLMAPFLSRDDHLAIFETDLLDDAGNASWVGQLSGLTGEKPWECVGEIADVLAILRVLLERPDWRDKAAIAPWSDELRRRLTAEDAAAHLEREIARIGPHSIPDEIFASVSAIVSPLSDSL